MNRLSRELGNAATRLEERWIDRINTLEKAGKTYGDPEYDIACENLNAVASEFWLWEEE